MKTYHVSLVVTVDGRDQEEALRKVRAMVRSDIAEVIDHDIIAVDEIADDGETS